MTKIYTIGYQGKDIADYMDELEEHNISCLIDVRKNPISRKRDFCKTILRAHLFNNTRTEKPIDYVHFGMLGIPSSKRKNLKTQQDRDELFSWYEKDVLMSGVGSAFAKRVWDIANCEEGGVALTCFEANPQECHRTKLAEFIITKYGGEMVHI